MLKLTKKGFTVVELMTVIVIIGILISVTTIAYRETQKNARNEKYKVDALMIQSALEDYYNENGEYPVQSCNQGGNTYECRDGQIWNTLVGQGYLSNTPKPDKTNHYYYRRGTATSYGVYVQREPTACMVSKGGVSGWWSVTDCSYS